VQTEKDLEVTDWIGRLGAAGAEHVMARFAMGRSWAYARLNRLVADGLLQQRLLLYRQPGLYVATAEGLRWCGLHRLGLFRVGPGGFEHARQVATAAAALHAGMPGWRLLGERRSAPPRAIAASSSRPPRWLSSRVAVRRFTGPTSRSSPPSGGLWPWRWSCR